MTALDVINKYYGEDNDLRRIFLSHAHSVAEKALQIAEAHPELNVDTEFLSAAALLHDIGIFLTNAPGIYCLGEHPYICHGYLGAELLRQEGLPRHAQVCERHTGTGLSLDEIVKYQLPIPHRDMLPQSIEEQIICFADKFFSKAHPEEEKSIEQVQRNITRHGEEGLARFLAWKEAFL